MARQLVQHVVEKPDTGLVIVLAGAIKIDGDRNICLCRFACDRRCAHRYRPLVLSLLYRAIRGMGQACVNNPVAFQQNLRVGCQSLPQLLIYQENPVKALILQKDAGAACATSRVLIDKGFQILGVETLAVAHALIRVDTIDLLVMDERLDR
jgi:hypothetical protein